MPADNASQPISGHKGRDRWMCALAAASDLSTMAIRLTLRLCVSFNCKTGRCDPGYRTLAKDMAVSERSVFRAIAELEAGGWIAVDRTGGDNTRNNQFTLLIPSAQVTAVVTRSGDNMVSAEKVSVQVTENGAPGDRNSRFQVTDRLAGQKNLRTCEPEIAAEGGGYHTSGTVRDSAPTNSATIPEPLTPVPRAHARTEPITAQQAKPSRDDRNIGRAANGADGALAAFAEVKFAWPIDRTDDEGIAYAAYVAALAAAQGDGDVVLDAIWERIEEGGADHLPWLSDALRHIERDLRYGNPEEDED
jgi:hypothetical protein